MVDLKGLLVMGAVVALSACSKADDRPWYSEANKAPPISVTDTSMANKPFSVTNPIGKTELPEHLIANPDKVYREIISGVSGVKAGAIPDGIYRGTVSTNQVKWEEGRPAKTYLVEMVVKDGRVELYEYIAHHEAQGELVRGLTGNVKQDGYVLRLANVQGHSEVGSFRSTLVANRILLKEDGRVQDIELVLPDLTLVTLRPERDRMILEILGEERPLGVKNLKAALFNEGEVFSW